jgi:prepilin-type N-terminal cleavage/methylation domain-containing protein
MSKRRGMTLFEMLVVILLFGVITTTVFLAASSSHTSYLSTETAVYVQQQARQALSEMERELRHAGGAIATAINQIDFQVNLGYNQAAPCPPNAVCWGARDQAGASQAGWRVRYRLAGVQLLRELLDAAGNPQAETRVLANDVTSLQFTYVGGTTRTVTIQLQVQRLSPFLPGGGLAVAPAPLVARVRLRNS